jgi:hypothetical protein
MPRYETRPPSVVTLGVISAKPSQRLPAIGRYSFCVWLTTCDISVLSVSTSEDSPETVTVSVVVCRGRERSMVRVWPTCSVKSLRTNLAKPNLLAVIS